MKKLYVGFKRLWKLATCNHINKCVEFKFGETNDCTNGTSRICVCRSCGAVISVGTDCYKANDHITAMAKGSVWHV